MVKITVKDKVFIQNLTMELITFITTTLWVRNPKYLSAIKSGNKWAIRGVPQKLYYYEKIENDYYVPYGFKTRLVEFLIQNDISYELVEETAYNPIQLTYKRELSLYDYQQEALTSLTASNNGILLSPAGSGKTRMGLALIGKRQVRTLWLTNKTELLTQARQGYNEFYKEKSGTITGGKVNIQQVTFATVQTMSKLDLNAYKDLFDLVIVDEVHNVSGSPTTLMQFYKVINSLNAKYKVGLTATLFDKPNEASSTPLFLIGEIIHEIPISKVPRINATYQVVNLETPPSDDYLRPDRTTDFAKQQTYLTNDFQRNVDIIENLLACQGKHNIVLSTRIEHLEILKDMLSTFGIESEIMIGKTNKTKRERVKQAVESGECRYLLSNYALSKEGLDIPILDTLHMVMPIREKKGVIQSIGRVERLHKNKTSAMVYDYVDYKIGNLINMANDRRRHERAK